MKSKMIKVTVRLSPDLYELLIKFAEQSGQNLEEIIVNGVIDSLPNSLILENPVRRDFVI